ncbi:peptidoglycan-binding domain-containing protein [Stappia sp. 28M-7]|uniref:peptidoglycan-binding domain-containing protein n=1 Tax=Stappia sp. 28M-7 TaxID=2762596 RepID=UPI00163BEB6A|nr:peptidoglycan-binding domain-containing protein [Stappia sp. 28M-7]MBC2858445.1 peptidoglycan-binding protein [Stappia sp. 28M-7]
MRFSSWLALWSVVVWGLCSPAAAQGWFSERLDGDTLVGVSADGSELVVFCGRPLLSLEIVIAGMTPTGPASVLVDDGAPVGFMFANGRFEAQTAAQTELVRSLMDRLAQGSAVTLSTPGGAQARLSLNGSSQALSACPAARFAAPVAGAPGAAAHAAPVGVASTAGQGPASMGLLAERYLAALGFDPGTVDGISDAATRSAVRRFQERYGLPANEELPAAHFAVLEALAKAGAMSVASTPAPVAPAPTAAPAASRPQPPAAGSAPAGAAMAGGGSYPYHRLAGCEGEIGRAIAWYNFTGEGTRRVLEMTDLCFNRETGRLSGSEWEDNLQLVRSEGPTEFYEVIETGKKSYQRAKASVGRYDAEGPFSTGWVSFGYSSPSGWPVARFSRRFGNAVAHLHGALFKPHNGRGLTENGEFKIHISGNDIRAHDKRQYNTPRSGSEVPYVAFEGKAVFTGGMGKVTLANTETGNGTGSGELDLRVSPDGEISGSGVLRLQSARLAGANPQDWKTTEWHIRLLAGNVAGDTGEILMMHAIAEGQTVDHDGVVNPVLGSLTINGYSRRIAELTEHWN